MRPAGRHRSVSISMTPARTASDALYIKPVAPLAAGASHDDDAAETEVILSPNGFETAHSAEACLRAERQRLLAVAIRQRIESRLGGRIRDLAIRIRGNTVLLEGRCATFYTKQLAQHAALGVIEEEQLENAIVVLM